MVMTFKHIFFREFVVKVKALEVNIIVTLSSNNADLFFIKSLADKFYNNK